LKYVLPIAILLAAIAVGQKKLDPPEKPIVQPLPYSHKQHLSLGLKCKECHTMPDPGESMGIPAATKCMACHQTVKADSEAIQKLAAYAKDKRPVPWVRVYQIPSYVAFSHKIHLETGATCQTCHGEVQERTQLWKEVDISMGGCMECHRINKASNDCTYCHEQRN
jgi:hypothetical protein